LYARIVALLLIGLFPLACAQDSSDEPTDTTPADALLYQPLSSLPALLSETGVFPHLLDLNQVAPEAIAYEPMWPLWSSGSEKSRVLVLPEGTQIDNTDPGKWIFPLGTLIFKTFSFPNDDGQWNPVETRLMRKEEEDWTYHVYQWNEEGTDAALISIQKKTPVSALGPDGETFEHLIPSLLQCRKCHESNPTRVIGFSELQLSTSADNLAPLIDTLVEKEHLLVTPTQPLPTLTHEDPLTQEVMGYMQGNCTTCHNGGDGPATSFDLHHTVMLENTVNMPTEGSGSADGIRVVPGHPEESILFVGFSGETTDQEVKMMPPLGADKMDKEAVELFRNWIESMEEAPSEAP
jgi:hypothetical protein